MAAPYETQLAKREFAYVEFVPSGKGNNIRRTPDAQDPQNLICSVPVGTAVEIVDGPRSDGEMFWWRVRARRGCSSGGQERRDVTGWTSEGTAQERWLTPIRPLAVVQGDCAPRPGTRLALGELALAQDPKGQKKPVDLHEKPGVSQKGTGSIPVGTALRLLSGPVCLDDRLWWEVRTEDKPGLRGWTGEGRPGEGLCLLPLEVRRNRPRPADPFPNPRFLGDISMELREGDVVSNARDRVGWNFSGDRYVLTIQPKAEDPMIAGTLAGTGTSVPDKSLTIFVPVNSETPQIEIQELLMGNVSIGAKALGTLEVQRQGGAIERKRWHAGSSEEFHIVRRTTVTVGAAFSITIAVQVEALAPHAEARLEVDHIELWARPAPAGSLPEME